MTASADAADRVALVIGVDTYDHLPPDAQLKVAVDDAERMASTLEGLDPPFAVRLVTDAEQRETEDALSAFVDAAEGAECALVYFAGHGVEYHGENFLLTRDTDVKNPSADVERMKRRMRNSALSLQTVVDELDATGSQVKVVILDACRNNPLQVADGSGTRSVFGGSRGLAQVTPPSGTLVAYSADAGQQANDGLFTEVLTEHLKKPGLPLPHVFALTRETVKARSIELAKAKSGVYHEPAEYTKLNLAGMKFSFTRGEPEAVTVREDSAEMVALRKQVESMKQVIEELRKTGVENEALKTQLAEMEAAVKEAEVAEERKTAPMVRTDPAPAGGFPASRGMEGSKAGEMREFGGIEMVWCPPGTFLMGSPEGEEERGEDETQHEVTLTRGFWLAKTECTQGQWESVMGSNPSEFSGSKNLPVETVSWEDCQGWLVKMNERHPLPEGWKWAMPTEAQWEYACRAGTETAFAFGNSLGSEQANFHGNYPYGGAATGPFLEKTADVGSYLPNRWGLFDMHGNVWEWCADWYGEDFYRDGHRDPAGPTSGSYRVFRGGGWHYDGRLCRSAFRFRGTPVNRVIYLGFRPAVSSAP